MAPAIINGVTRLPRGHLGGNLAAEFRRTIALYTRLVEVTRAVKPPSPRIRSRGFRALAESGLYGHYLV